MGKNYPEYAQQLQGLMGKFGKESPAVLGAFVQLHKAAGGDSALSAKMKELIALGISVSGRCEGCIAFHTRDALKAGATRAEVIDTIGVAVLMGGGPSMIYACEALQALDQFQG